MDVHPTRANKGFTRKKKRDPVNWKANVAKRARYSSKSLPDRICEHNTKALKCATLTMRDLLEIHQNFYKKSTNSNIILFKLCSIQETKRRPNFKDGCGGQNKNSILIGICCKWLLEYKDTKVLEIIFPFTGHSFMPADRVFGIIEKKLRKREVILDPKEITDVISESATLSKIGVDCNVYDWKAAIKDVVKPTTMFTNIQLLAVKSQPRKHVDVCAVIEGYFAND
ncbi:unnamed protein product [Arctia plantaginis]|uniref:DUF7869 domain-containing protein n=1 Tax=Arctia plantaginis TaxID=874455 RepID=A0A8S1ARM1_ARCPL|nr:unnamed protein product [Arctia plantaginis]